MEVGIYIRHSASFPLFSAVFCKVRGFSVEQLGDLIGWSKATVYKYESGPISVDVNAIAAISKVLEIEPTFLFDIPSVKNLAKHSIAFFNTGRLR